MGFLYFLFVGAISGWLAGQLWKGSGFGLLGNIVAGVVGGMVGGFIAGELGIGGGGMLWQIIISAGGAWFLLFAVSLFNKKTK